MENLSNSFLNQSIKIKDLNPSTFIFNLDGKEAGRLFVKDNKLVFDGDVDESAKVFFDKVIDLYNEKNNL